MKKIILLIVLIIFLSSSFITVANNAENNNNMISEVIDISEPYFIETGNNLIIFLNESNSNLFYPRKPQLPIISKTYSFPLGTKIKNIEILCDYNFYKLNKKIKQCSNITYNKFDFQDKITNQIQNDNGYYPDKSIIINTGGGLSNNKHVIYFSIQIIPQYNQENDSLKLPNKIKIFIEYETPKICNYPSSFDLLIISPQEFYNEIQPLIDHKIQKNLRVLYVPIEEIYDLYDGFDKPEKIKKYIFDTAISNDIKNLLLIGSKNKIPMRTVFWNMDGKKIDMLVDLYYSDFFDANGSYCSWDANGNNIYGEKNDNLDYYPDINLGRLPCDSLDEVKIVVDKIINYENSVAGSEWFSTMILMAGDTFPEDTFPDAFGREGENLTIDIMNIMDDFHHSIIWTSKGNFNRKTISNEINKGAGFIFYAGHGFPNGICPDGGSNDRSIHYYNRYINDLENQYRLPIIFLEACSTAKLDFNLVELIKSYLGRKVANFLSSFINFNEDMLFPCLAWNFVKYKNGGAIATIGSTQYIMSSGYDSGGCMNPPRYFFSSYNYCDSLGQMHTEMINKNILDIPTDVLAAYTIEEHILIGDPSLIIGRYSI